MQSRRHLRRKALKRTTRRRQRRAPLLSTSRLHGPSTLAQTNSINRQGTSMKRLLFHRQEPVEESPCGIAFDEEKNEVVIAEYAADGAFEIHRLPADEPRAVNITTGDIRTCVLGWNAHT